MDKLDRLLTDLDHKVADAQRALADLSRTRDRILPGDYTLTASVWRRGAAGKPAKTLVAPFDRQAQGGHKKMQEQMCLQHVATAALSLQQSMNSLSSLLAAGPELRRLDAWPEIHVSVALDDTYSLLSLKNHPSSGHVSGLVWPWEHRTFHRACRLLLETQTRMGHGPVWTVDNNLADRVSKTRKSLDAQAALVLHALTGQPGILEHRSSTPLRLSRLEPNLKELLAEIRGTEVPCIKPGTPDF